MENNLDRSTPLVGMDRDKHPSRLESNEYSFALNINIESSDGLFYAIQNEPSNIKCRDFKDSVGRGFKVVGYKSDLNKNCVYFFIKYDDGISEIVRLWNERISIDLSDELTQDEKGNYYNKLSEPLERRDDRYEAHCSMFESIISDCGDSYPDGYCLGFDINNPVYDIVLKNENCGDCIYWAQKGKPARYLDFQKLEEGYYSRKKDFVCGDEEDPDNNVCINCDKLRVFPLIGVPEVLPDVLQEGGVLPEGVYEFLIAYCDSAGTETSQYYSLTNPIHIFDKSSYVSTGNETRITSLGIKLKLNHVDDRSLYYKIAVICTLGENMTSRYFIEGIHPSSEKVILFTDINDSLIRATTLSHLFTVKRYFNNVDGMFASGNRLFLYGLEEEPEWNLQPIANLAGIFMKWQTGISMEDLYEDGANVAKYSSYMRDEVYPIGFRVFTNKGYVSADFPFIARPARPEDLIVVRDNTKYRNTYSSITENSQNCVENPRIYFWQFFNSLDRDKIALFPTSEEYECINTDIISERKTCTSEFAEFDWDSSSELIRVEIDSVEEWSTLEQYFVDNPNAFCDIKNNASAQKICDILKGLKPSGVIYQDDCGNSFNNGKDLFSNACDKDSIVLEEEIVSVNSFEGLYQEFDYKSNDEYSDIGNDSNFSQIDMDEKDKSRLLFGDSDISLIGEWICDEDEDMTTTADDIISNLLSLANLYMTYPCSVACNSGLPLTLSLYNGSVTPISFSRYAGIYPDMRHAPNIYDINQYVQEDLQLSRDDNYLRSLVLNLTTGVSDSWVKKTNEKTKKIGSSTRKSKGHAGETYQRFHPNITRDSRWIRIDRPSEWKSDNNPYLPNGEKKAYQLEFVGTGAYSKTNLDISTSERVRITFFAENKKDKTTNLFNRSSGSDAWVLENIKDNLRVEITNDDFSYIIDGNKRYYNSIYIVLDTPIVYTWYFDEENEGDTQACVTDTFGSAFFTTILPNNISIALRTLEPNAVSFKFDKIFFNKTQVFVGDCTYCIPKIDKCSVYPYQFGEFAYWQSVEKYPGNKYLYNSYQMLKDVSFTSPDIGFTTEELNLLKEHNYIDSQGNLIEDTTNFCQKNIRHFKFPDNINVPFVGGDNIGGFSDSVIYPIGITIDAKVIRKLLKVAYLGGLLTKEQYDSIIGFELIHGNRAMSKSVIATGIGYDMFNYKDVNGNKVWFSNFPYNDLSENTYLYQDASRKTFIRHPDATSSRNNRFTFHSPDTSFRKPILPSECKLEGFMMGKSFGSFQSVENHPEWVIIGTAAYNWAAAFASVEALANYAMTFSDLASKAGSTAYVSGGLVFSASWMSAVAVPAFWVSAGTELLNQVYTWGRYRYDWLNIFINNGQLTNFAYYYSSVGFYNSFIPNNVELDIDYQLRGIELAKYLKPGNTQYLSKEGQLRVNNRLRESSVFLSMGGEGEYAFRYPSGSTLDNSRVLDNCRRDLGAEAEDNDSTIMADISSPYFKLKNYMAAQYGDIDSVLWENTGRHIYFDDIIDIDSPVPYYIPIYGGDIVISRFSLKRKFPFFHINAMGRPDMHPFAYNDHKNVGYPRYYVNFDTNEASASQGSAIFPNRKSYYNLNCDRGGFYKNGRFYLFSYGIPQFLVESDINLNYRLSGVRPEENFYPNIGDYVDWTQEAKTSIVHDNYYRINPVFSKLRTLNGLSRKLPSVYDMVFQNCAAKKDNGVVWSTADMSENDLSDPWLVFKPLDYYQFPTDDGKLIDMKGIESELILARFEDRVSVYNSIDILAERVAGSNELGTGGIFHQRARDFNKTELGYTGSQSKEIVSNEYGHFWVDVKRANVFAVSPNASDIKEVTTGVRNWMKEYLPFKILKYNIKALDTLEPMTYNHVSNKFLGLGISLGWDSRHKRVFITKKDYIPIKDPSDYRFGNDGFYYIEPGTGNTIKIDMYDPEYFKDLSFTIGYNMYTDRWVSYYSFMPDFYISQQDYFQTALNFSSNSNKIGIWTHPLSNQSFNVFYGELYPMKIRFPVITEALNKMLSKVSYWMEARRYQNEIDYAVNRLIGFNKATANSATNNSGLLNLIVALKNNMYQRVNFPMYNADSMSILQTEVDGKFTFNFFFNRVIDDLNNIPQWIKDENDIERSVNPLAIRATREMGDRLRGDWFMVELVNDIESRYKFLLKWVDVEDKKWHR